jgi:hypothetical protein
MKRVLGITLQLIGGIAVLAVIVAGTLVIWPTWPGHAKVDQAKPGDLLFVLNWGEIGEKVKIQHVLRSYESRRSLTGDHIDVYSMQIDTFPEEVLKKDPAGQEVWLKPPLENPILVDALETSARMAQEAGTWFPSAEVLNSDRFYVSFPMVYLHNQSATAGQLTAYDRHENKLYHADWKW